MNTQRSRRSLLRFGLASFLIVFAICGVLQGVFGRSIWSFTQAWGIFGTIFCGVVIVIPLACLALCVAEMFTFLRRSRRAMFQFSLATLLIVTAICGVLLGVYGRSVWSFIQTWGIVRTLFYCSLVGMPSVCLALCLYDMFAFFRDLRIVKRRRLPDSIRIEVPEAAPGDEALLRPRKKVRIINRSSWVHSRWLGPSGYR